MDYNDYELLDLILENDEIAYNIIVNKYKKIIYSKASSFCLYLRSYYDSSFVSYDDLIAEGFIALNRAIRSFNPFKEAIFYSYFLICLNSNFNLLLRSVLAKKNIPLLSYKEFDFEISDSSCVNPYDCLDADDKMEFLKEYLYNLGILDSAILELRLQKFKYKEIISLLEVTSSKISRVINKFKDDFTKIYDCNLQLLVKK